MFFKSCFVFITFFCLLSPVQAQIPLEVTTLNMKNGLPSNRVYQTAEGPRGIVYVATNNGLSMYDGYRFFTNQYVKGSVREVIYSNDYFYFYASEIGLCRLKNIFDSPEVVRAVNFYDSLPDNDHYEHLFADRRGRVWCAGMNDIKYFLPDSNRNGQFYRYPDLRLRDDFLYFCEPSADTLWLVSSVGISMRQGTNRSWTLLPDPRINRLRYTAAFFDGKQSLYLAADRQLLRYDIATKALTKLPALPDLAFPTQLSMVRFGKQRYLIAHDPNTVYALNLNLMSWSRWYHATGSNIRDVKANDALGILWIASGKGLIKLKKNKLPFQYIRLPDGDGSMVRSITADGDNNIWITAGSAKIWRISPGGSVRTFPLPDKSVGNSLTVCDQQIMAATSNGVYQLQEDTFERIPLIADSGIATDKVIRDNKHRIWVLQNGSVAVFDGQTFHHLPGALRNKASFWRMNKINDLSADATTGRIWIAAWMPASFGIAVYDAANKEIRSVASFNDKGLFMGDYYTTVASAADGTLLFSGFGGWNRINRKGKIIQVLNTAAYNVGSTELHGISGDGSGNVWFGTPEGLFYYQKSSDKVFRFSQADGLPTNDFTHGFCDLPGPLLALGVKDGILLVNQNKILKPNFTHKLLLTAIKRNGKLEASPEGAIRLENNATDLYLYFSALSFSGEDKVQYRFRFTGDTAWTDLGNVPELHFSRLEHGNYQIVVMAGDKLGHWQRQPLTISLEVPPPFYKQIWFILLLGAFTGLLAFCINRYFFLQKEQKKQMLQQLKDAKLAALRNQMNPHFLFNTLNSINSYIIRHHTDDASNYLTLFSKLIRNMLTHSQQPKITVKKELQTLQLYLELEGMRLNHSFDYSLCLPAEIDAEEIEIPPLILQPFVENAIWHGLRNKKDPGNIDVIIQKKSETLLQIIIRDNGVGRVAAARRSKTGERHSSLGINITSTHLKLLNEKNDIKIIDHYDAAGTATGTEVVITLNI